MGRVIETGPEDFSKGRAAAYRTSALRRPMRRGASHRQGAARFGGRSVLEIVARGDTGTYRTIYTARFRDAIYVLHAFQKKSNKGIATPKKDMDVIAQRLAAAEQDYRERHN